MAKKVTMQQIADYLGVSKFVVSKALSGKGGVSETTRERVIQAASQLGYFNQKNAYVKTIRSDAPAPAAGGKGKQSVLALMPNIRFQTKENAYWGRILDGISVRLEEENLGMMIISESSVDHFLGVFNPGGILGLIGVGEISTPLLLGVHRVGLPMVLVDHEDPLIPSDTVFANNFDCMFRLTNHLLGIGHRNLVFVGSESFSRSFRDRWLGFRAALEENGFAPVSREERQIALEGIDRFQEQIKSWLAKRKRSGAMPTALVCANDSIALDALRALQELGLRVPDDVSVTGFDNIEDAWRNQPALTTVNVPKEKLGARAVEMLLARLGRKNEPYEKLLVAGEIIYRESIAEVSGRRAAASRGNGRGERGEKKRTAGRAEESAEAARP
jgi:LacI family transcriptional regulator